MIYSPEFVHELKERSGNRCECERGNCHAAVGRCITELTDTPGEGRWEPIMTGDHITYPPIAANHIALCDPCIAPRTGSRRRP
jgi:hypothetical protein